MSVPKSTSWGYEHADVEQRPFDYLNVNFVGGRVVRVEELSYLGASYGYPLGSSQAPAK